MMLDESRFWIPTPGYNQSSRGGLGKYSSPVCLSLQLIRACYGLSVRGLQLVAVLFHFCHEENNPDPKSGQDLDPDKPVFTTSYRGDVIDPAFSHAFMCFTSPIP